MKSTPPKSAPSPGSALTRHELKILRASLRAAECMSCMCFNGKQQDAVPEAYRKCMEETGEAFDKARRSFTKRMRRLLGPNAISSPTREEGV